MVSLTFVCGVLCCVGDGNVMDVSGEHSDLRDGLVVEEYGCDEY